MFAYKLTALATLLSGALLFWFGVRVGKMRIVHQIKAPAMTGHPEFEQANRVQQNTIEQMILFLPALWLFAVTVSDFYAGIMGFVWCFGRIVYALAYWKDPAKRSAGFGITALAWLVCFLGALYGLFAM